MRKIGETYVDLLRRHLEELTSSFGRELLNKNTSLTPREVEVCSMVRGGLSSKEVARLLNVSYQTVEKHRKNIRRKLGLTGKGTGLASHLRAG